MAPVPDVDLLCVSVSKMCSKVPASTRVKGFTGNLFSNSGGNLYLEKAYLFLLPFSSTENKNVIFSFDSKGFSYLELIFILV